jgi:16S rRNA (cytosine1402-N4)-methyltransferase
MSEYHIPVMLQQCIEGLSIRPGGCYVDATYGGGGHAREILKHLPGGTLFAFDQDEDAALNIIDDPRLIFVQSNFRYLKNFLRYYKVHEVDGILADLGVSSHDFDEADRGFSFRFDAPLDMRMNQKAAFSAATLVNTYTQEKLVSVFREFGEIRNAGRLAAAIVSARTATPLKTTGDLLDVLRPLVPKAIEKKYLAQVFQALRMEVNDETGALKEFLASSLESLKPEGRLVVLTYHSIEDRLVKNFMRSGNFEGTTEQDFYGNFITPMEPLIRKAMVPTADEVAANPRSRSAKLRIAVKKEVNNG